MSFREFRIELKENKHYPVLIFLLRLLALAIPLYLVIWFANLYPLQVIVAQHSRFILGTMGFDVIIDGFNMRVGDFQFFISEDSTGWKSMMLLFALIFAIPKIAWKKRLIGLLGIPLIYIGNLGRVISIVLAEKTMGFEAAMTVHDLGWRLGLVVLVLILWVIWLKWAKVFTNKNKI